MTLKFKSIKEARQHLLDSGYAFDGYGQLTGAEFYKAGPLTAMVKRAARGSLKVVIR